MRTLLRRLASLFRSTQPRSAAQTATDIANIKQHLDNEWMRARSSSAQLQELDLQARYVEALGMMNSAHLNASQHEMNRAAYSFEQSRLLAMKDKLYRDEIARLAGAASIDIPCPPTVH